VWNAGGCDIADRWMAASNGEWYVVLKIFPGFEGCTTQPDNWVSYLESPSSVETPTINNPLTTNTAIFI